MAGARESASSTSSSAKMLELPPPGAVRTRREGLKASTTSSEVEASFWGVEASFCAVGASSWAPAESALSALSNIFPNFAYPACLINNHQETQCICRNVLGSLDMFEKLVSTVVPVYLNDGQTRLDHDDVCCFYLRNWSSVRFVNTMLVLSQSCVYKLSSIPSLQWCRSHHHTKISCPIPFFCHVDGIRGCETLHEDLISISTRTKRCRKLIHLRSHRGRLDRY